MTSADEAVAVLESTDEKVEANSRLTASTGAVLLVLLALEGLTLWSVRSLLTWHVLIGVMVIPIVVLKLVTTGQRFVQYYRGDPAYRRKGPPHPILRVCGPFVSITTVLLIASGTVLILGGRAYRSPWLEIHQAVFIAWCVVMSVHVLGHALETARVAPLDWRPHPPQSLRRAGVRRSVLIGAIVVGLVAGIAIQGEVTSWGNERGNDRSIHHDG